MSQKSKDENKSSRSNYTREISTRTDSEKKIFQDHFIRHVSQEFMPTPSSRTIDRAKPRKSIKERKLKSFK